MKLSIREQKIEALLPIMANSPSTCHDCYEADADKKPNYCKVHREDAEAVLAALAESAPLREPPPSGICAHGHTYGCICANCEYAKCDFSSAAETERDAALRFLERMGWPSYVTDAIRAMPLDALEKRP